MFRSMVNVLCILLALTATIAHADPTPFLTQPETQGKGTKDDPYIFDASTPPILTLNPDPLIPQSEDLTKTIEWDLSDGPPLSRTLTPTIVTFPTSTPGIYLILARWEKGWSKAWLVIPSGSADPSPNPDPLSLIPGRVKSAFTGPDRVKDSQSFAIAVSAVRDAIVANQITTKQQAYDAFSASLKSVNWTKSKYPALTALTDELVPPVLNASIPEPIDKAVALTKLNNVMKGCALVK